MDLIIQCAFRLAIKNVWLLIYTLMNTAKNFNTILLQLNERDVFEVVILLTLFRMWGQKASPPPPLPVSPLQLLQTYELTPKTFWALVLTLLPHWPKILSSYLVPVPIHWPWTKTTPQKKRFFWSNPYKIEVMITSFTKMLEAPNFGHMTTFTL